MGYGSFIEELNTQKLEIPHVLVNQLEEFFDKLFEFKQQADGMISLAKTDKTYDFWKNLNQNFNKDIVLLYEKLEKHYRKILTENLYSPKFSEVS